MLVHILKMASTSCSAGIPLGLCSSWILDFSLFPGCWAAAGLVLVPLIVGAPDLLLSQGGVDALLLCPPLGLFGGKKRC